MKYISSRHDVSGPRGKRKNVGEVNRDRRCRKEVAMGLRWLNFELYIDSQWDCDGSNANYILIVNGTAMAQLRTIY